MIDPNANTLEIKESRAVGGSSYPDILKSSAIIGGSTVFGVVMRILRVKIIAVILGPSGVGLLGVYSSITQLAETVAVLGVETSGVRLIAEAKGKEDGQRLARETNVLRRGTLWLGLIGAIVFLSLSLPISQFTFGNEDRGGALAILSITIFFGCLCAGQRALVQGLRRIADLAAMNMVSALSGSVLGIVFIYFWGEQGIVPLMVAISGIATLTAWWFSRRITVAPVEMTISDVIRGMGPLLKLGLVFMSSTLMSASVAYLARVILVRQFGMDGAGIYQAASALSAIYVGFVLQAMGADFYPRLVAAKEFTESNRLVNEQVEVGLLLAAPGVVATLTFSSFVIDLFYSAAFAQAVEVLRWQILGVLLQVVAWPMGYFLVAQGRSRLFFWTELASHSLHFLLIWAGIILWGLPGAGVAFFLLYMFSVPLLAFVVRRLTGFKWSSANVRLGMIIVPITFLVFISQWVFSDGMAMMIGFALTTGLSAYSLIVLRSIVGWQGLRKWSKA